MPRRINTAGADAPGIAYTSGIVAADCMIEFLNA